MVFLTIEVCLSKQKLVIGRAICLGFNGGEFGIGLGCFPKGEIVIRQADAYLAVWRASNLCVFNVSL